MVGSQDQRQTAPGAPGHWKQLQHPFSRQDWALLTPQFPQRTGVSGRPGLLLRGRQPCRPMVTSRAWGHKGQARPVFPPQTPPRQRGGSGIPERPCGRWGTSPV